MNPPWTVFLDHAAIATRDTDKLFCVLRLLGLVNVGQELVKPQGVRAHFVKPEPSATTIEILEVVDEKGTVAKYLEKKGAGVHHLSFRVEANGVYCGGSVLDLLCAKLRTEGIRLTFEQPQPGAHHTRVNFIHPESTGGVLIEISEKVS